ncbi:MAG: cupredoxin domain-containing protein [Terriglobales bacterium]|jgi:cytochrome c oxidase subunit 2
MRLQLACYLCVSTFLFSPSTVGQEQREQNVQVIQMTAKKYEYSPSPVHVKQGTRVRLKITAIDRDHGITIATVPEGADPAAPAGLEFTSPQPKNGWKLLKGKEATIEFVARRAGIYEFKCSVTCGLGHGRMKGQLVVDP